MADLYPSCQKQYTIVINHFIPWAFWAKSWQLNHPDYFTSAFFHDPSELESEVEESGFQYEKTLPIAGPLRLSSYVTENFNDPVRRELYLMLMRQLEEEPSLLGISAHLLVVARKV